MKTELNLELHTDNDGIKYYELSKGTPLYRTLEHENGELESKPTFFALNPETVKENYSKKGHGYPHKFTLNQDVKLIALDVNNPIFYEKAIKIQKELEKHYGMNKQKRIRDSDNTGDTKVLKHICDHYKKTYQGYYADQMETHDGSMHAEVGLCNNKKLMMTRTMIKLSDSEIENFKLAMISKKDKQLRSKRAKKRMDTIGIKTPIMPPKILSLSPMSPMALNFGDDDDLPVKKLSFGGRRRTKRVRRKRSKTRKRFRKTIM